MNEKIILPSSDEAASVQTVTGWVSRLGHYYGKDEGLARYDGSTHRECKKCGKLIRRSGYCVDCYIQSEIEKYEKMERREWNGTDPLYSHSVDKYFWDENELEEYLVSVGGDAKSLRLIICVPVYATEIDPADFYGDDLDDGKSPDELQLIFDELNVCIRESKIILSWQPGPYAADVEATP